MARDIDILREIETAVTGRARSPLRLWMQRNFSALDARLSNRRADWKALSSVFERAGLMDGQGNPPNAATARKTWQRVRNEMKRHQSTDRTTPQPNGPNPTHSVAIEPQQVQPQPASAPPAPPSPWQSDVPVADPYAADKPRFGGFATLRSRMPKTPEGDKN